MYKKIFILSIFAISTYAFLNRTPVENNDSTGIEPLNNYSFKNNKNKQPRLDVALKKIHEKNNVQDDEKVFFEQYDDFDIQNNRSIDQTTFEIANTFREDLFCKPVSIEECQCSDERCLEIFQYSIQAFDSISNYSINYEQFGESVDAIISDISKKTGEDENSIRNKYLEKLDEIYINVKCLVSSQDQCVSSNSENVDVSDQEYSDQSEFDS